MTTRRCGPLAAWATAWMTGAVGPDQVIDAVTGDEARHWVTGLPDSEDPSSLLDLLTTWRRFTGEVRAVFPVPGDVRGLPGPNGFRAAALDAGEAVCGPLIGVVPEYIDYAPSSAPPTVHWVAFEIDEPVPDFLQLGEAQFELTAAIRHAASALAAADVPGWQDDFAAPLRTARRVGETVNLPPGYPSRAVALVAQAERMRAVLDIAARDPVGGAYDRVGIAARHEALQPLELAVRRALTAGYNAWSQGVV